MKELVNGRYFKRPIGMVAESILESSGALPKAWYDYKGKKYLVKGSTLNGHEPYSEVLATILAELLGIETVRYYLAEAIEFPEIFGRDGKPSCASGHVSVCESYKKDHLTVFYQFCSYMYGDLQNKSSLEEAQEGCINEDLLNYMSGGGDSLRINVPQNPEFFLKYIVENFQDDWQRLFKCFHFDAIIGNVDRHLNNWDVSLTFDDNLQIIRKEFAPFMDFGSSFLSSVKSFDCNRGNSIGFEGNEFNKSLPFGLTHDYQLSLLSEFQYAHAFDCNVPLDELYKFAKRHVSDAPKLECIESFLDYTMCKYYKVGDCE